MSKMSDIVGAFISMLFFFGGLAIGAVLGRNVTSSYCKDAHIKPMDALGIEKFQKCEINTTNCHSNWYEIIWKEKTK